MASRCTFSVPRRSFYYINQSNQRVEHAGLVWHMIYLKRNHKWGYELFSATTSLEPNSKVWETNIYCGQNSAPGVWSFVQASDWRKLRKDSVTIPGWPDLLRGCRSWGKVGDFSLFLPLNGVGLGRAPYQNIDFIPRKSGRSEACQREEKFCWTKERWAGTQTKRLFWTFSLWFY